MARFFYLLLAAAISEGRSPEPDNGLKEAAVFYFMLHRQIKPDLI